LGIQVITSTLSKHDECEEDDSNKEREDTIMRLPTLMKLLKVGDELFASCSQEVFGTIVAVNADPADETVDVMVNNIADLIALESGSIASETENQKVLIKDLEIDYIGDFDKGLYVGFKTVAGCNRCVRSFNIRRDGKDVSGKVAVLV
jgi:hypothetical protein